MSADINLLFMSVLLQSKSRNKKKNNNLFYFCKKKKNKNKNKYIENHWENSDLKLWFLIIKKEGNPINRLAWEKWLMSVFDAY